MVKILLESRENVKEILVVLGNDDPRADFVLSDRTSHNQRPQSSPKDNQQERSSEQQAHPMAYQPTAEEIAAKKLAASKTWYDSSACLKFKGICMKHELTKLRHGRPLEKMSFHGSGDQPTNRFLSRDSHTVKQITIRISQDPWLAFVVTDDSYMRFKEHIYFCNVSQKLFSSLKPQGMAYENPVTYSDLLFNNRTRTVNGPFTTFTSDPRPSLQVGETCFHFCIDFDYQGAEEFYTCAKHLAQLHRRCWESHVIAWSPITDMFNVDTPDNIKLSAAEAAERALYDKFNIPH